MKRRRKKLKKKVIKAFKKILIIAIIIIALIFINKSKKVTIELNGDTNTRIEVGNEYQDELFKVINNKKDVDINKIEYKVESNLDINTLGTYDYKYIINYNNREYSIKRTITIVDETPPEIIIDNKLLKKNVCNTKKKKMKQRQLIIMMEI